MKRSLAIAFVTAFAWTVALSEEAANSARAKPSPEQIRVAMQRSRMKRYGGLVRQPNSERGQIVIVNRQTSVDKAVVEKFAREWEKRYRYIIVTTDKDVRSDKSNIVIRLEEVNRDECIIVAPENFWVSVNVKALGSDNAPKTLVEGRLLKELKRAFAFICGGTCSTYEGGLCGVASTLADIDAIAAELYTPDMDVRIANNLCSTGIKPYRIAKYADAVQEGWAPAPTNEYQQAIWDKVHAVPKAPMKIEFDPKKGK